MVVGINGYGFIGYHLWAYINYKCKDHNVIKLSKELNKKELKQCDIIIHMAEKNRGDIDQLYKNNTESALYLVNQLKKANHNPQIIYTSSIHENADNLYGKWR